MSQQCSWPTLSWPLEGRCLYYALLGLTQAPGFAEGPDSYEEMSEPKKYEISHFSWLGRR